MQVAWIYTMRLLLIDGNIFILSWSKNLILWFKAVHCVSDSFSNCYLASLDGWELKSRSVADTNETLSVLWYAMVYSIKYTILNIITKIHKFMNYQIQIPFVTSKNIRHILEHKDFRLKSSHRINKNRKAITCVFHAHLIAKPTERLARRTTYHYVNVFGLWIFKSNRKKLIMTFTTKIIIVCFNCGIYHFISNSSETCSFKTQRQSPTPSEQIQHDSLFLDIRH